MTDDGRPPTIAKGTAFYGVIQGAVAVRANTQELYTAIKQYAARNNLALPSDMFQQVNSMRALAAGNRNASEHLNRARDDDFITNRHIGAQIFARSADRRAGGLLYRADFTVTSTRAGMVKLDNYHLQYSAHNLPSTVGELRADIYNYSASLSDVYGQSVIATTDIAIGAY